MTSLDGPAATLTCASRFADPLRQRLATVTDLLSRELGRQVEVTVVAAPDAAEEAPPENPDHPAALPAEHPLVRQAISLFNARIVAVQPRAPKH